MGSAEIRSLLQEVVFATDPKSCGLSDYHDLQELLRKVAGAAERLLDEREQLNRRLRRSSQQDAVKMPGGEHGAISAGSDPLRLGDTVSIQLRRESHACLRGGRHE